MISVTSCKKILSPEVLTSEVTSISYTTATCGGELLDDGGSSIISQGVCWSTLNNPTTSDNVSTFLLCQNFLFIVSISQLDTNTTYFVRAFATNNAGTSYGETVTFKTLKVSVPSVSTYNVLEITDSSAKPLGILLAENGGKILTKGFCYCTSGEPQITDNVIYVATEGMVFGAVVNGLTENTSYALRAFATNIAGTGYGNSVLFRTKLPSYHE